MRNFECVCGNLILVGPSSKTVNCAKCSRIYRIVRTQKGFTAEQIHPGNQPSINDK